MRMRTSLGFEVLLLTQFSLICKRRHVKCDEERPQYGLCAKGGRSCIYISGASNGATQDDSPRSPAGAAPRPIETPRTVHTPLQVLVDACHYEQPLQQVNSAAVISTPDTPDRRPVAATPENAIQAPISVPASETSHEYIPSPSTETSVASTRVAALSWFELLATDAANADNGFLLSPPQQFVRPGADGSGDPRNSSNLQPRSRRERESFEAAAFPRDLEAEQRLASRTPGADSTLPEGPSSWTTPQPISLSALEHRIFHHFVRDSSQWLDFYDPSKHFSSLVPHLALRNSGLMKALLALSARHLSLGSEAHPRSTSGASLEYHSQSCVIDRNLAVQYYYETLNYLNKAMQYPSYARSRELIATALLISTYEMIDGSNQDWERHLKGVFWIQRFQDNDGESGGIRQAVWWTWLQQDIWVAMRERRRVFSFWRAKKPLATLTAPEMATRATYLLAQCVNYASNEEQESSDLPRRLERGSELLYLLQEWHDHLPQEYNPLPTITETSPFAPIWVHPAPYAAALQVHSLSRILVILHRPSAGGLQDYRAAQRLLAMSVSTICGLACTVGETDSTANLISLQCLFGAGMCVYTVPERLALLDLLDACQARIFWPLTSLRKELELEYGKDEISDFLR